MMIVMVMMVVRMIVTVMMTMHTVDEDEGNGEDFLY